MGIFKSPIVYQHPLKQHPPNFSTMNRSNLHSLKIKAVGQQLPAFSTLFPLQFHPYSNGEEEVELPTYCLLIGHAFPLEASSSDTFILRSPIAFRVEAFSSISLNLGVSIEVPRGLLCQVYAPQRREHDLEFPPIVRHGKDHGAIKLRLRNSSNKGVSVGRGTVVALFSLLRVESDIPILEIQRPGVQITRRQEERTLLAARKQVVIKYLQEKRMRKEEEEAVSSSPFLSSSSSPRKATFAISPDARARYEALGRPDTPRPFKNQRPFAAADTGSSSSSSGCFADLPPTDSSDEEHVFVDVSPSSSFPSSPEVEERAYSGLNSWRLWKDAWKK